MSIEPAVGLGVTVVTPQGLKPATIMQALSSHRFVLIFDNVLRSWGGQSIAPNSEDRPEAHIMHYSRRNKRWNLTRTNYPVEVGIRTTNKEALK